MYGESAGRPKVLSQQKKSGTYTPVSPFVGIVDVTNEMTIKVGDKTLVNGRLNAKTGIPFHVAEDPLRAIARGTGIALKNINRFSFLMK